MERYPLYCILLMKSKMDSISLQSVSMPLQVQSPMSFMLHDASILMLRNCLKNRFMMYMLYFAWKQKETYSWAQSKEERLKA